MLRALPLDFRKVYPAVFPYGTLAISSSLISRMVALFFS